MENLSKYYAVRVGRKLGIYTSWEDCKKQVVGYSGASYKSFSTLEEAENYLNIVIDEINDVDASLNAIEIYVDGSFNESLDIYAYGCIILDDKKTKLSGVGTDKKNSTLRNVAGELYGAMEAIKWAITQNYERVVIYHDYEGISKWATGEWNASKVGTKEYVNFIKDVRDKIHIHFEKVKAHSGNEFNEVADSLAKKAIEDFIKSDEKFQDKNELVDHILFNEIVTKADNRKNVASFILKGYILTEAKLIKVAKVTWKNKGYKTNDINVIKVKVDANQLFIDWLIIDKSEKEYSFSIYLDQGGF